MGGVAFVLYWWVGQPTSSQVSAYKNYFRTGNELFDLHEPITTDAQAREARPALRAKAEEHLQYRNKLHCEGRRGEALERKFSAEWQNLFHRFDSLMQSKKPIVVFVGAREHIGIYTMIHLMAIPGKSGIGYAKWEVMESLKTTDTSIPGPVPASDLADRLRAFAGMWDAKDISFKIGPDGRGRAELGTFSQGTGSFTISEGGKPLVLTAEFTIAFLGEDPRFGFTLRASSGLKSAYEFAILPNANADELIVKEAGDRIKPNPVTLKRRASGTTPVPVSKSRDPELEGEWKMQSAYLEYTGAATEDYLVTTDLRLRINEGALAVEGPVDGVRTTSKYTLVLEPQASPKKFKMTNVSIPGDFQEGIYDLAGDRLLMRTMVGGKGGPSYSLPGVAIRLGNADGKDSDLPKGFVMPKGDPASVIRYAKVKTADPGNSPALALRDIAGKWDSPEFSLVIEADGKGMAGFDAGAGGKVTTAIGHYTVDFRDGRPHIAFTLTGAEGMPKFEFTVLEKPTSDTLVVKELGDRIKPNPIAMKRRAITGAKPEIWKDVPLPLRDTATRAVIYDANGFHSAFGGTVAIEAREVPGKGFQTTAIFDNPGSIWSIGKSGVDWNGTKFPEGSIVAVDGGRVPRATKGDHRALIVSKTDTPVYADAAAGGIPIATVKANAQIQLLMADAAPTGVHKVRLLDGGQREGWIKGGWDTATFQQRVGGAATPPAGKTTDAALEGVWILRSLYGTYTGRDKENLIVNGTHKITVRGNVIEILGSVDDKPVGEKYTLELDPAASPKKYTIRSALNPDDTESGIYWVEKDTLLMRPEKMGTGVKDYTFSGANISSQDSAGDDSAIPKGFLRKRGDPGFKVMRFEKAGGEKLKPAKPTDPKMAAPDGWKSLQSEEGRYRVSLPGVPDEGDLAGWPTKAQILKVGDRGSYLAVGYQKVDERDAKEMTADQLLDGHASTLVADQRAHAKKVGGEFSVKTNEKLTKGSIPGRAIQVSIRGIPFTDSEIIRTRKVYVRKGVMYVVEACGLDGIGASKDAERFFASFEPIE